jgi:hypothetical protein
VLVARIGLRSLGRRHSVEATQPMRAARRAKLATAITAELGEMPSAELERHIDYRIRQHMLRMALKSSQSRRRARENMADARAAETELASLPGDRGSPLDAA